MYRNMLLAEAIGTFSLVFAGCGAIIVNDTSGGSLGHLGVCIAFGLIVMAMIYSFGNISGAHINPAVTIAFTVAGRLDRRRLFPYLVSQFCGAIAAAVVLRLLFPENSALDVTLPSIPAARAFTMECLLSFLLMLVILNVSTGHKEKGIMAGVAVGGAVALGALVGGPVTGGSMNPARSLGPALIAWQIHSLWIYLAAPVIGMLSACPTCRWIQGKECCSYSATRRSRDA